jgi:hypothetical protein
MKRTGKMWALAALGIGGMVAARVDAQSSGGPYRVAPVTVATGGGASRGGTFGLRGTLGQIATATLTASGYRVYSGFWTSTTDQIFANGFDS